VDLVARDRECQGKEGADDVMSHGGSYRHAAR
jgi:hypothetical protein